VAYFFDNRDNIRDEMHREHEGAGQAKDGQLGSPDPEGDADLAAFFAEA
jgi:hypothetical protein